jgi:RNA polymerase sigma-70 factor (ECF subfamily)
LSSARRYALMLQPLLGSAAGYARSILRNRQDAEDAVQQAALRGLERVGSYDESRPFKAWWFAIVRNCCIDLLRQRKSSLSQSLDGNDQPQKDATQSADWEEIAMAMNRLSEQHREVLQLRYFADLNYAELAESLNIPVGTVMSRLHLARKALQAQIHKETP